MKSIIIVIIKVRNINRFIYCLTAALYSNMQEPRLKKKREILLIPLALLLIVSLPVWAQENIPNQKMFKNKLRARDEKTAIQIFAGPSISFLRGNTEVDNNNQNERSPKYGYSIGISLNRKLTGNFNISYGLIFEKKGGVSHSVATYFDQIDQTFKQGTVEYEYIYEYFTAPLQIFHRVGKSDKFSVGVGPYFSFLKNQIRVRRSLFPPPGNISYDDETDSNTKLDFGIITSILFKVPINSNNLISVQITNTWGLLNIRPNLYQGQVMKTNNTSLLIGFITKRKKI